ncbi:hypothetical protein M3G15_13650 [Paenibacillus sp. p3-SID1389]|uniref:hypothetical protein n=1 Tax=Paenibacillus sp. p3-SID1389 TaxID=2916364 RepID=UPI0021A78B94|nr:hypothetical protein [Paenibacillus sp. p3-SID1389]MCT2196182.1 hypothetical protein [Paenibacillus sp. p3-SID1389]
MKSKKEAYGRLSIAVILFVLSSFMPNLWSVIFIDFVGLYALVSGLIHLRRLDSNTQR